MTSYAKADEKSFDNKQLNAQLQLNLEEIDSGAGNCVVKLYRKTEWKKWRNENGHILILIKNFNHIFQY